MYVQKLFYDRISPTPSPVLLNITEQRLWITKLKQNDNINTVIQAFEK